MVVFFVELSHRGFGVALSNGEVRPNLQEGGVKPNAIIESASKKYPPCLDIVRKIWWFLNK